MEAEWMQKIPSSAICNFFYAFFVLYAVIFVLSLAVTVGAIGYSKKMGTAGVLLGLQGVITTLLGGTAMLFYYLVCDRALINKTAEPSQ